MTADSRLSDQVFPSTQDRTLSRYFRTNLFLLARAGLCEKDVIASKAGLPDIKQKVHTVLPGAIPMSVKNRAIGIFSTQGQKDGD